MQAIEWTFARNRKQGRKEARQEGRVTPFVLIVHYTISKKCLLYIIYII